MKVGRLRQTSRLNGRGRQVCILVSHGLVRLLRGFLNPAVRSVIQFSLLAHLACLTYLASAWAMPEQVFHHRLPVPR